MERSLMDKLTILADSANMTWPVHPAACPIRRSAAPSAAAVSQAAATPLPLMAAASALFEGPDEQLLRLRLQLLRQSEVNDVPGPLFRPGLAELVHQSSTTATTLRGLFLSSAVLGTPDYTTERMLTVLQCWEPEPLPLRRLHPCQTIPGTSPELIQQMGYLADRLASTSSYPASRASIFSPRQGPPLIFRPAKQMLR